MTARLGKWISIFTLLCFCCSSQGLVSDGDVLLKFKASLIDRKNILNTWGPPGEDPCDDKSLPNWSTWRGVSCSNTSGRGLEVSGLELASLYLVSDDATALSGLTKLLELDLGSNSFSGPLPDLGKLDSLLHLRLDNNEFLGNLPRRFPSTLKSVELQNNHLSGPMDDTNLLNLGSLQTLDLGGNNFTGLLPDMSGLPDLTFFDVSNNKFQGPLPSALSSLNLYYCNMSFNNFSGSIEVDPVGAWSLAGVVDLSRNALSGPVSSLFSALSAISYLDLGHNMLEGPVPSEISDKLGASLTYLNLQYNFFTSRDLAVILTSDFSALKELYLGGNLGVLPWGWVNVFNDIARDNRDRWIRTVEGESVSMNFPDLNISCCPQLRVLDLNTCGLNASIHVFALQMLPYLSSLDLSHNRLWGLPFSPGAFSGMPQLQDLNLRLNPLAGTLQRVDMVRQQYNLSSLKVLDLRYSYPYHEGLTLENGWIEEALKLPNLKQLRLAGNMVIMPSFLPSLDSITNTDSPRALEVLDLSNLALRGSIPSRFASREVFPSLKSLDLSQNDLHGSIPDGFWEMQNLHLDISKNSLSGKLTTIPSVLVNPFIGNKRLCYDGYMYDRGYDTPDIRFCSHGLSFWKIILIATACGVALGGSCLFLGATWRRRIEARQHQQDETLIALLLDKDTTSLMSLRDLKRATNDFSEDNEIGVGGFGRVYKGVLADGSVVAVKKSIRDGSSSEDKSQFLNEVKILSQVHHRNLVKLLGCCLTNSNALLVFEFVPNGNLQEHLILKSKRTPLSWDQRLLIALQTADALDYLHTSASPPIYHLDVKSANILLDGKLNAKVADFGISKLAAAPDATHVTTLRGFQGTFGYMDPELALKSQLTGKSDVYAFGAVMLELITAKAVVDRSRGENVSLVNWAGSLIRAGRLAEVVDPAILDTFNTKDGQESINAIAELAMCCLSFRSEDRPSMKLVSSCLLNIQQKNGLHKSAALALDIKLSEHQWVGSYESLEMTSLIQHCTV